MRIINSHCHLIEIEKALGENAEEKLSLLTSIPTFKDSKDVIPYISVSEIIRQMDNAGIEKTILFACICPILYASNEFVAENCMKYPDKFIGFASIDPHQKTAVDDLDRAINQLNLKGLKLHPPMQNFYPDDKIMWPVYDLASQLDIPVVFHVGSTPFGNLCLLNQAYPVLIDEVAVAFPKLKIILTHLGTLWSNESFMVTEKNANVFIDTAAYPYEIEEILTEKLIKRVGEDKFIFGTDFPMPYEEHLHEMKDFVTCINKLKISDEIKEKIFYKNLSQLIEI